jgi:shikimate kinase
MGSGKSTHGKKLAKELGYEFIDLDTYIEERESMSVQQIFDNLGEDVFREKETQYLEEIISKTGNIIVSLGGGTICFHGNINKVLNAGLLIYVKMPPDALCNRLIKSRKERPLLKNKTPEQILSFISTKLSDRKKFYEQAHVIVNGINLTASALTENIYSYWNKSS